MKSPRVVRLEMMAAVAAPRASPDLRRRRPKLRLLARENHLQQVLNGPVSLQGMPERLRPGDVIAVAPPLAFPPQDARVFEFPHDPLHGPLGDADRHRDFTEGDVRLARQADQDMGVVGQKGPAGAFRLEESHLRRPPPARSDRLATYVLDFVYCVS